MLNLSANFYALDSKPCIEPQPRINKNAFMRGDLEAVNLPLKKAPLTTKAEADSSPLVTQTPSSLANLVDHLMEAMVVVDEFGAIQIANQHAKSLLLGADNAAELVGQQWQSFLCEPQKSLYQKMIIQSQMKPIPLKHLPTETKINLDNGSSIDVEISVSYLPMKQPLFGIVIRDLSKFRVEYQQLHHWASTDCLTNLANRRIFDTNLKSHWQACSEAGWPISVVIIDIDHFKSFNDKYGHILGDRCLQKVANAIKASVPNNECTVARYGGEEFALILPNLSAPEVEQIAQLVQKNINALTFIDIGLDESVSISVSQGYACEINGQFRTANALLCAADTALYRAKTNGRNRINASC
ncbi:diguanylate cyclase [Shewanella sp. UCD-KL21]|uniref:sensor domain-containing diguanylate cyclase n=1 Tax=Shewanella sp. UCD-KL21 TaxID=1917164 RepID=UPI00158CD610|nr:diguanylate cyclase [Shewanella sp. UCD-KL21]